VAAAALLCNISIEKSRAAQESPGDPEGLFSWTHAWHCLPCEALLKQVGEAVQGHQVDLLRAHERMPSAAAGRRLSGQLVQQVTPPAL